MAYNLIRGDEDDNTIDGTVLDDRILGLEGDDRLAGLGGTDRLEGGTGDDQYVVEDAGDLAIEFADQGYDIVESAISFTLAGQYIEELRLTGSAAINGTGNSLDNLLRGNDGANILQGGGGNDVYVVGAGDQVIERSGEGHDRVESSVNFSLAGQYIEDLTLAGSDAINGTGNGLDNVLTGNGAANGLNGGAGDDVLDGRGGADLMIGGAGDDTYHVDDLGDLIRELAGEGTDTVHASVSFSMAGQHIEALVLTGTDAIDGRGNGLANTMTGNGAANIFRSGDGDDVLNGLDGDDWLSGGGGADRMTGGAGADSFVFETVPDGQDLILDFEPGIDRIVLSKFTFHLPALGELPAGGFYSGTPTGNNAQYIIFDPATRILYTTEYAYIGGGGTGLIPFAVVAGTAPVTAADFLVI